MASMINWIFPLVWLCCYQLGVALDLSECGMALGMETKEIKDEQILVSSSFDESSVGPKSSRIRTEIAGGAWCPAPQISKDAQEWLEINLISTRVITAVETQGRYGDGKGLEYPTHFMLEYSRPGLKGWVRFRNRTGKEIFDGNSNPFMAVSRQLDPPVIASKIRFIPYSTHPRTVCMRVELHGCSHSEGLLSYSMAQGAMRSDVDLRDKIYDGILTPSGILTGGLGLLSDGKAGGSTFLSNLTGNGPGYEWVGWKNTTVGPFMEMTFRFDSIRNFSSVNFHVNNQYKQEIKAFSMARLWFSNNGKYYSRAPSTFVYPPANFLEASHWVKVKTPNQHGAYVKIQLIFGAKWLLMSEIQFDSNVVRENLTAETDGLQQLPEPKIPRGIFMGADDTDGLQVAPLEGVPTEYIALIIGVMVASLIVCSIVVIVIMIRQRRQGKLSSTAYGFKLLQQSSQRPSDLQVGSSMHSKSNLKGNMYVLDSGKVKRSDTFSQTQPNSLESFHFPPPPPQEYTDSSDYAEPQFCNSASTLPLLPRANQRNPTFTHSSSPKKLSSQKAQVYKLDDESLHYASSDVTVPPSGIPQDDYCQIDGPLEIPSTSSCEFPRDNLIFRQAIGAGDFGEVFVCDIAYPTSGKVNAQRQMVAVKMLRKSATEAARQEFLRELKILSTLRDPNLVQLLGCCIKDEPWLMVLEYFESGDLHSYLRKHSDLMSVEVLLHMCSQIASGMKFLEVLHFVHRDLACRNCLVGDNYAIKVADLGMTNPSHADSYYKAENAQFALPIRWMAWESISANRFTPKSDVWAFAVTTWEIFSLCATKPYESLTNEEVIANTMAYCQTRLQTCLLPKPLNCPTDVYRLMLECWQVEESSRPSFKDIHMFLQRRSV